MKRIGLTLLLGVMVGSRLFAQYERERERRDADKEEGNGFKQRLFTGGSIALGLSNNSFLVGGSPMFGYNLARWADIGIVGNYNYTTYRDVSLVNDKLHQSVYGGGGFIKLYPVRFLFAQAQFEHNTIREKYFPPNGGTASTNTTGVNSFLIGAGYTTNRDPEFKRTFFYLSILFDVSGNAFSPYTNSLGNAIPVLKAGIQVPLFQRR